VRTYVGDFISQNPIYGGKKPVVLRAFFVPVLSGAVKLPPTAPNGYSASHDWVSSQELHQPEWGLITGPSILQLPLACQKAGVHKYPL